MAVLPPKITGDQVTDSWAQQVTETINRQQEEIESLTYALKAASFPSAHVRLRERKL